MPLTTDKLTQQNTNAGISEQIQPAPEQIVTPPQTPAPLQQNNMPTVVSSEPLRNQLIQIKDRLDVLKAEQVAAQEDEQKQKSVSVTESNTTPEEEKKEPTAIELFNRETNRQIDSVEAKFNRYTKRSDNLLRSQVSALNATFEQRREQARQVADNAKRATNVIGSRTGRLRYAPDIQAGILTGQENALIETLSRIDAEEAVAIAAAEESHFNRDYTNFLNQMEAVTKIEDDRKKVLSELQTAVAEENKKQKERLELQKRDIAIVEQFSSGETDPVTIFRKLNGEVPYDLIVEYANTLPTVGETSAAGVRLGRYDRLVNPITGEIIAGQAIGGGISGGSNSSTITTTDRLSFRLNEVPTDANLAVAQIGPAIYGTRISNDESKRIEEIVEKGIAAGQTLGEIMLITAQFDPDKHTDLASELVTRLRTSANPTDSLRDLGLPTLAALVQDDELESAVRFVENASMDKGRKRDPNFNDTERIALVAVQQQANVRKVLYELPDGLSSAVEGTVDEWLGRFRKSEQTKLKTRVTEMTTRLRHELLGSAVTATEEAFIEALIPKLSDQPAVFMDKVNRLSEAPLEKLNQFRLVNGLPRLNRQQLVDMSERVKLYESLGQEKNAKPAMSEARTNAEFSAAYFKEAGLENPADTMSNSDFFFNLTPQN